MQVVQIQPNRLVIRNDLVCTKSDVPRLSIASHLSSVSGFTPLTLSVKTECDREERSFIKVAATARRELARSRRVATDRGLLSGTDH
jgi:hypothetical protein